MNNFDATKVPLGAPPNGQQSNLVDAESRAWIPRLAIYTTFPVAICFVLMRISVRVRLKHVVSWDDYFCLLAVCTSAGLCGIMMAQRKYSFVDSKMALSYYGSVLDDTYGRHFWNVSFATATPALLKQTVAITSAYDISIALTKLSLLTLFLRIFSPSRRSKIMIWFGIAFIVVSYATLLAVWIAYSVPGPNDSGWGDPAFFTRVGQKTPGISVAFGVLGIVSDFYVISIPLTAISTLNLSSGKKIGVSALFATGLLACAFCVAGMPPRLDNYRATVVDGAPDPLWLSMPSYGLAVAEINLGIVCASVPVLVPMLKGVTARLSPIALTWRRYKMKASSALSGSTDPEPPKESLQKAPQHSGRAVLPFTRGSRVPRTTSNGKIMVTHATEIRMAPYPELRSVDMDYHTYLGTIPHGSHTARAQGGS